MLNYLNQEKNMEGKTSIFISKRKVMFIHHSPSKIFFPKEKYLSWKTWICYWTVCTPSWSQEKADVAAALILQPQNREWYQLKAQCVGTKKQTKKPRNNMSIRNPWQGLEKAPPLFILKMKDFFVYCRHWCVIFIPDPPVESAWQMHKCNRTQKL